MEKIIFATHNAHKLDEARMILGGEIEVIGLSDIGCTEEIFETAGSLEGNARLKAEYVFERYRLDCFADDTGLEVMSLNGKPGVYSARYAGENSTSYDNVQKLLREMEGLANRAAQFRTVIAFIENGTVRNFEGTVSGRIGFEPQGSRGFGYDPVFYPDGYEINFAQMDASLKNSISHRALAMQKFADYLLKKQ